MGNPASVTYTERSVAATVMLAPLTARKRSDDFWLFLSGLVGAKIFTKNANSFQLLIDDAALGAAQRMGKRDIDSFVLILGDNT